MKEIINREQWLNEMVVLLRPVFQEKSYPIPENVKVSCGYGKKNKAIGVCVEIIEEGRFEIFISPEIDDIYEVCNALVHELSHACVGGANKHNSLFQDCVFSMHLDGPARSTQVTEEFKQLMRPILEKLPEYPHKPIPINPSEKKDRDKKTFKAICRTCGYTVSVNKKWLDEAQPICPLGHGSMDV